MKTSTTRQKLLDAAHELMLSKGYAATSVEDVCKASGLTKGSFFHYFPGKQALGEAVADEFYRRAQDGFGPLLAGIGDPLDRVKAYLDVRQGLADDPAHLRCMLGTFVQELFTTHPHLREVCATHLDHHIEWIARDLAEAKARYAPQAEWDPRSVSELLQSILQGAMILSKASRDGGAVVRGVEHFRAYLQTLFPNQNQGGKNPCAQ